jgi:hypothetical protein
MSRLLDGPQPIRSGIVIVDPDRGTVQRVIVLQFNPDSLERSIAPQASGAEAQGDRVEALRLKGAAIETWKFTAELDSTDQLDVPSPLGIHPYLAALEILLQPPVSTIRTNQTLSNFGTLEISPVEAPLTLFSWGAQRVVPVRLTELSISEEAFDANLSPVRATLSIGLRILTPSDLPVGHRGAELYLAHLAQKETLAKQFAGGTLTQLGSPPGLT